MALDDQQFFAAALSAGAILTGFCGTFLSFRIQREANYHRQPTVDFAQGKGKDVFLGLSHFSSAFLMLILASLVTITFGLVLPLLALANVIGGPISPKLVAAGLLSGVSLICGYFWIELRHYNILSNRLAHDRTEWGLQTVSVVVWIAIASGTYFVIAYSL